MEFVSWDDFPGSGFLVPGMVFLVPMVFFFPGMVFSVPGGFGGSQGVFSSRAGAFSVPRFGFAVPGMVCWAPVGVFCSRNGVSGSRPEGTAWRCLWFPYGVSSCFFLLLCFSLFVASFLFFPFLISSASASLPVIFLFPFLRSCLPPSLSPPALPLTFLRSFPFLVPALASFPSLSFPFRPLPAFPSRT